MSAGCHSVDCCAGHGSHAAKLRTKARPEVGMSAEAKGHFLRSGVASAEDGGRVARTTRRVVRE